MHSTGALLVLAVAVVGVLHTAVPDHWAPIALLARRHHWSNVTTARTAAIAGLGHVVSTLLIAVVVWAAGAALAVRFGHIVSAVSSLALIAFGLWIALASWREMREHAHGHEHAHPHHHAHDAKERSSRTALLLIVGSSPMVEGIPAFFAASRYGAALLAVMAVVFALSTIVTYVVLCVLSARGMQRLELGRFEQYGEVLSGAFIAALGVVFLIFQG